MFDGVETSCLRVKDISLKTFFLWFKGDEGLASWLFLDLIDSMGIG